MKIVPYKSLTKKEKELVNAAQKAIKFGYNPYKEKILFGAAVRTESGRIIVGANMANHSSTSNICAERSVILTANNIGERKILELAMIVQSVLKPSKKPVTPCGICRQFLSEIPKITGKDLKIYCVSKDKSTVLKTSINELLPNAY